MSFWRFACATTIFAANFLLPAQAEEAPSASDQRLLLIAVNSSSNPAPEEVTRLDEVTAVATRTERSVDEVPAAVSVISDDELNAEQADDLGEALENVPSVAISGGPRANAQSVVIRGIGGTRVLLSVDGARQNFDGGHRSRLLVDPALLKSVEVLRGPASGIYGSGAIGGVIAAETKDAADLLDAGENWGALLKLGYEDAASAEQQSATLFGRIGSLDLLASISHQDEADLRQGGGEILPFSALKTNNGLAKLGWFVGEAHEFSLGYKHFQRSGITPSNPSQEPDDDNPLLDRETQEGYSNLRYIYTPDAGPISNAQVTVYQNRLDVVEDRFGEPRHDELEFETRGGSAQLSLDYDWLSQRLTIGADAYVDTASATRDGQPRPQFPDAEQTTWGVFVQDELSLFERLLLTPSARYDQFESRSNTGAAQDIDASETSFGLGSLIRITGWLSLNASYGEAFRAPNLVENYASGTHFLGNEFRPNPDLSPENARNLDLGFRLKFASVLHDEDQLSFNATWFENRVEDFIETVVVTETAGPFPPPAQCLGPNPAPGCINIGPGTFIFIGGFSTSINLPEAELKGHELQANYRLGAWNLEVSKDQVRGENKSTGEPLLNIPADTLRAHLSWSKSAHRVGWRITHASAQNRVPPANEQIAGFFDPTPGYTVSDLYYRWTAQGDRFKGLSLTLGVDNISDRRYRRHLSLFNEAGRSGRASLSYRF